MSIREFSFASANGRDEIMAWGFLPLEKPRGVVQIVHGLGEHSRRYLHLICRLLEAGYAVYADDHAGHGKTAAAGDTWGDPGNNGYMTYIEDERKLHDIAEREHRDVPYIMFGHSWGSMIARKYAAVYPGDLSALILCGVVMQMAGCENWKGMQELQEMIRDENGAEDGSAWFGKIFTGMTDRYENPEYPTAWVALNKKVVSDHLKDPFNCMQPTNRMVYDFVTLYEEITRDGWADLIPAGLPIYLIAGDQDPCGNYGEGVYRAANDLIKSGHQMVKVRCYPGYRHEIQNEPELRDEVATGVLDFIKRALGKRQERRT